MVSREVVRRKVNGCRMDLYASTKEDIRVKDLMFAILAERCKNWEDDGVKYEAVRRLAECDEVEGDQSLHDDPPNWQTANFLKMATIPQKGRQLAFMLLHYAHNIVRIDVRRSPFTEDGTPVCRQCGFDATYYFNGIKLALLLHKASHDPEIFDKFTSVLDKLDHEKVNGYLDDLLNSEEFEDYKPKL